MIAVRLPLFCPNPNSLHLSTFITFENVIKGNNHIYTQTKNSAWIAVLTEFSLICLLALPSHFRPFPLHSPIVGWARATRPLPGIFCLFVPSTSKSISTKRPIGNGNHGNEHKNWNIGQRIEWSCFMASHRARFNMNQNEPSTMFHVQYILHNNNFYIGEGQLSGRLPSCARRPCRPLHLHAAVIY